MIYRIRRHAEVENDILELAEWIARTSPQTAYRFLDSLEATILSLRFMPGKGSPKVFSDDRLAGVRSWAVRGFPKHLILYEVRGADVLVYAVVHGAQDYQHILADRI